MASRTVSLRFVAAFLASLATVGAAIGHEGPPYPLLLDQRLGDYVVSVWADPDIGEAKFFVIVETPDGGIPAGEPQVSMWYEPTDGRTPRETISARPERLRDHLQFEARPYFDIQDWWNVGFRIESSGGKVDELTTNVESTPPGYGAWDLAVYSFPFAVLGVFWIAAMLRRRKMSLAADPALSNPAASSGDHCSTETGQNAFGRHDEDG